MTGEFIWYLLFSSLFLSRWKEAGGTDAACGSCESGQVDTPGKWGGGQTSGGTTTGTSTANWGGASDRKIRDVSQTESMLYCIKIDSLKYLIFHWEN